MKTKTARKRATPPTRMTCREAAKAVREHPGAFLGVGHQRKWALVLILEVMGTQPAPRSVTRRLRSREPGKLGDCDKHRCGRDAVTVELETGEGAEPWPSTLCGGHARRPGLRGTYEQPVLVGRPGA